WIKLEDGGPVYYNHERVGKNGRIIKFLKFRTMVVGAEAMKKSLLSYNDRVQARFSK
ncbi:MAG: sugar transferase, partial [Spirochaetaceae bacterium]